MGKKTHIPKSVVSKKQDAEPQMEEKRVESKSESEVVAAPVPQEKPRVESEVTVHASDVKRIKGERSALKLANTDLSARISKLNKVVLALALGWGLTLAGLFLFAVRCGGGEG